MTCRDPLAEFHHGLDGILYVQQRLVYGIAFCHEFRSMGLVTV